MIRTNFILQEIFSLKKYMKKTYLPSSNPVLDFTKMFGKYVFWIPSVVPSITTLFGIFPHIVQKNPSSKSISSKLKMVNKPLTIKKQN